MSTNSSSDKDNTITAIHDKKKMKFQLAAVGFICFLVGYFSGREHHEYEAKSSITENSSGVKEITPQDDKGITASSVSEDKEIEQKVSNQKIIDGFDGYSWNSTRDSILQIRGTPSFLFDTMIIYKNSDDSVGGYAIDDVTYFFEEGCSKIKESLSQPCKLWGGSYGLEAKDQKDFEKLTTQLSVLYGDYTIEVEKIEKTDSGKRSFSR